MLYRNFFIFLLPVVFISTGHPNDKQVNGAWKFYKVSSTDVFGGHNFNIIQNLKTLYDQVEINVDDKFLTIKNSLLKKKNVCSVKYNKIQKTPVLYFHSDTTVTMHRKLFSQEGVGLANDMFVLMANDPSGVCPPTYGEIIKINDYLALIDHYYAVFFRMANANSQVNKAYTNGFLDYCKDANKNKTFDGSDRYTCNFIKKNINEAYKKIREVSTAGKLMKENLSTKNLKYPINDGEVSYQRENPNTLKITITHGGEIVIYEFQEKPAGTQLVITVDTGY